MSIKESQSQNLLSLKVFASDFDGTIRHEEVDDRDIQAIIDFRKKGHKFGVVTGRAIGMIKNELTHFGIEVDFLIGNNGAIILNQDYDVIYRRDIPKDKALNLIQELKDTEASVVGCSDGHQFARYVTGGIPPKHHRLINATAADFTELVNIGLFNSIFFRYANHTKTRQMASQLQSKYQDWMNFQINDLAIDVTAKNVNKATGVACIQKLFNTSNIYTFGDNHNDLEMIQTFSGFAIENAEQEIKDAALKTFDNLRQCLYYVESL